MNVLFFSPGFPAEMPRFVQGLVDVGARVFGLGDQPAAALPPSTRKLLSGHVEVKDLWNSADVMKRIRAAHAETPFERVECLWEPGMILAAEIREALGLPGLTVEETQPFRDKEIMKQRLDSAGLRTPRHARAKSEKEIRAAAEKIGYPLIVKPVAGAGSLDTYRIDEKSQLDELMPKLRAIPDASVEEFIDGEEFTFDTLCAGGKIAFFNVGWYRPRPLIDRTNEWISPQTVALRDVDEPDLAGGIDLGRKVIDALDYREGYTHMEWFRKHDGEVVFGEIAARPPGARTVDVINFAADVDTYTGWAEAVCRGNFSQHIARTNNAIVIFKRAQGQGRIRQITGLPGLMREFGRHVCHVDLAPVGSPRRNWKHSLVGDGYVIIRHPELASALHIADSFGERLQLHAR